MSLLAYLRCLGRRHARTAWTPWERYPDGSWWRVRSCTRCPRREYRTDRYAADAIITNTKEET